MKHKTHKKGFTLIELLVVMSIIALLLSILMPALGRARAEAMLTKDQTQVKSIYSGFSFWAPSHNGRYPIPGLEQRLEDPNQGFIKGRGPENLEVNDHASMLSMCIMQQLFTPDVLIAPTEQSDVVYPKEFYDYDAYVVADWTFWDNTFVNDLENDCNNSYGIMPVTGKRKHQNWGVSTYNPTGFAIIGTRGPQNGTEDPFSQSNLFHGIDRSWKGVTTFGDGHTEILETFYPIASTYVNDGGEAVADNLFAEETDQAADNDYGNGLGQGADIVLTHVMQGDVTDSGKGGGCSEFLFD